MELIYGIGLVLIAGMLTGTFMWPMKVIKELEFEHYWFIGMLIGLLLLPWLIVFLLVPDPIQAYSEARESLLIGNLLSIGWGIANVLYGICIVRIGAALSGAILTSFGVSVGVLLPMILKGSGLFNQAPEIYSKTGLYIISGVIIILVGVFFISKAGFGRDKQLNQSVEQESGNKMQSGFLLGLILAIIAGILSSCISLTFVYSQGPIIKAFKEQGVSDMIANIGVWAGALLGGVMVNLIYPAILMTRNRNWAKLVKFNGQTVLAAIIGIQLITGAIILGRGMVMLGALGASVGFGIQQAMQIAGNQAVGFISGEWKGIRGIPIRNLISGLLIILVSIIVLALASS
jgi:L-rhamnose-H+ transport protein